MFNVNPMLYSRLSNSDKKIADFFIEHEEDVLKSSIHELAQLIGVSSSSISRFVRKINGSSFSQTKVEMAKSHMQDIYTKSSEVISLADDLDALPGKLLTQINIACEDVVRLNSQKSFEATIDLLEKAEVVYFFGVGTSGLIAVDLQQKLIKIGKKCIYHYDSNFGVLNSTTTTPNDVVIAISYNGKTPEILLPVRRSRENGAKIVTFTNSNANPLSKLGDVNLFVPDRDHPESRIAALFSRYEQLYMVDILFLGLCKRLVKSPERVIDNYHSLLKQMKE